MHRHLSDFVAMNVRMSVSKISLRHLVASEHVDEHDDYLRVRPRVPNPSQCAPACDNRAGAGSFILCTSFDCGRVASPVHMVLASVSRAAAVLHFHGAMAGALIGPKSGFYADG